MIVETVKVVTESTDENSHGYIVINKSDLTDEHTLFGEDVPKENKKADKTEK